MSGVSEEVRICQEYSHQRLDSTVSDYHIYEIANRIVNWEILAPEIYLTESEQGEIRADFHSSYYCQKTEALRRWKSKSLSSGKGASYRSLIKICCSLPEPLVDLAEAIARLPGAKEKPRNIQTLDILYWYLVDCYKEQTHPAILQWPSKYLDLSALPTSDQHRHFFDLILHEAPLNTRVSDMLPGPQLPAVDTLPSITLGSVLVNRNSERLLVYFEGVAGCGKSTLSWHACNEWAEKRLLKQFDILIHVHLNDPHIQSASRLSDIIPHPDRKFRQEVESAIVSLKGKGVCFLLDGLDEAFSSSSRLFDFLLKKLIPGKPLHCPKISVIMTSRPNVRVTKGLEAFIKSRVVITGFKKEALGLYLDQTLGADTDERKKLAEVFVINPRIEGLCSLPINAAIMSFLMPFVKDKIPTTQTELYRLLVCNFLVRHVDNCSGKDVCIDNLLSGLPDEVHGTFTELCSVAYSSSRELKQLFKASEVDNALGFLHVHRRITVVGPEQFYGFYHVSIQEFLAAIHLSKMDKDSQIRSVREILSKNPLSLVLSFYAGLTRLTNKKALKLLSECLHEAVGNEAIVKHFVEGTNDPQHKALAFMNCLYECNNESLLCSPETDLPHNTSIHQAVGGLYANQSQFQPPQQEIHSLSLHCTPLTALDCVSLGCYINAKSRLQKNHIYAFDLFRCSLDPIGIRLLFTELKKNITKRTQVDVQLTLACNKFDSESLLSLKELVKGQSNIVGIGLCSCFNPSVIDLNFALKCLIEGLSNRSSCTFIDLSSNHFRTSNIYHIILMLRTCPQISWLDLKSCDLSQAMPLFSRAVAFTTLWSLDLSNCNICSSGLNLLGKSIRVNWVLHQLILYNNRFDDRGLGEFLELFVDNPYSLLHFLGVDKELTPDHLRILERIGRYRLERGRPVLLSDSYCNSSDPNFLNAALATIRLRALRTQWK